MWVKLLLIADDLTGAMDTSACFAERGAKTLVYTGKKVAWQDLMRADADVVSVNTKTRHLPKAQAADIVRNIVSQAKVHGVSVIYKKTDSALRGNIGAEIQGMMEGLENNFAAFVPAFPQINRTVKKGKMYIEGIALENTKLARDPFNPVFSSEVASILKQQLSGDVPVNIISDPDTWNGEANGIWIFDGETKEDLMHVWKLLRDQNLLATISGCGGFAEVLAEQMFGIASKRISKPDKHSVKTLFVCGSLHENSLAQIQNAMGDGIVSIPIPQQLLLSRENEADAVFVQQQTDDWLRILEERKRMILSTVDPTEIKYGLKVKEEHKNRIDHNIGFVVRKLMERGYIDRLCVFGGDTIAAILEALQIECVSANGQILPGIAIGTISFEGRDISLITKAGSFGTKDVIGRMLEIWEGDGLE